MFLPGLKFLFFYNFGLSIGIDSFACQCNKEICWLAFQSVAQDIETLNQYSF